MSFPKYRHLFVILTALVLFLVACNTARPTFVSQEDILFHDAFVPGETGRWLLEGDQVARTALADEQLVIAIDAPNTMQFTTLDGRQFADFVLEVETQILAGHPENSFGLLFRMMDLNRFYRFELTGSGVYLIERHNEDGSWTRLAGGWTESDAIKQGLNQVNRLRIGASGREFTFSVNDEMIAQVSDPLYPRGNIALDAGTFSRPGIQVAFDNLIISRP